MSFMTESKKRPFIPAEDADQFSRWRMPEMTQAERQKLVALARRSISQDPNDESLEVVEEPLYAEKITVAEWEKIRDEAYQDGFKQGREQGEQEGRELGIQQGKEEGLKAAQPLVDEQLDQLKQLIENLKDPLREQEQELHKLLLNLVIKLTEEIVESSYAREPELLLKSIQEATRLIPPTAETPVFQLHPEDCLVLGDLAEREGWELKENPEASRGDIRILAGSCVISQDLQQRVAQVASTLFERIEEPQQSEAPKTDDAD